MRYLLALALLLLAPDSLAQSRSMGKLVVPVGYEQEDSIRFSIFDLNGAVGHTDFQSANDTADKMQQTFEESYGDAFTL